jgi:recombination protein RecR
MRILPRSVEKLIEELSQLPGIGHKSASRLTFFLLKLPEIRFRQFASAIAQLRDSVRYCTQCQNMSEGELCDICSDTKRDQRLVCVVEDSLDVVAVEQTRKFTGTYHVLGGALSPIDGIGPEQLNIATLENRIKKLAADKSPIEIILATNPSLEGDATALYLTRLLKPLGAKLTKLGRGIPVGGDLEYTDEVTLSDALAARREVS